jgi:hypothetical protein
MRQVAKESRLRLAVVEGFGEELSFGYRQIQEQGSCDGGREMC